MRIPGKARRLNVTFQMPGFQEWTKPLGWLDDHPACKALMYYAMLTMKQYHDRDKPQYEDEPDFGMNQFRLMESIGKAYGVTPEMMIKYWADVDAQFVVIGAEKVPNANEYRQTHTPNVKTH